MTTKAEGAVVVKPQGAQGTQGGEGGGSQAIARIQLDKREEAHDDLEAGHSLKRWGGLILNMWLRQGWAKAGVTEATVTHIPFGTSSPEKPDCVGLHPMERGDWGF